MIEPHASGLFHSKPNWLDAALASDDGESDNFKIKTSSASQKVRSSASNTFLILLSLTFSAAEVLAISLYVI